ncbi:flagellar export chaperone FliS [Rhodoferax sp. BLA1]|uniref:flagellar export chaperone FliS n=1 Tax=Rhodoferax sp. BLA1 TaxID=2576062 RepID=UPI0015D36063|nr:flagellar export chaperone FliS [Rhodoferax sp. BLA1]
MFTAYNPRAASAYQRINIETSMHTIDQYQIVSLLFDGLLESMATARGALARGDVATKCNAIAKALRILQEGLTTGLDPVEGGELAANLGALYGYCSKRLMLANATNDDLLLQEVQRLIEPVAQGWKEIGKVQKLPEPVDTVPAPAVMTPTRRAMSSYSNMSLMGA